MNKLASTLLLLSAFCLTTACDYSDENPSNTVGSAAKALKSDNNQKFLGLLTGSAKAEYQNPAAIAQLQDYIEQFRKLKVASETLIHETAVSNTKRFRTYALEVTGSGRHALNVEVKCQLNYGTYTESFQDLMRVLRDRPDRPERPDRPQYDPPAADHNPNSGPGVGGSGNYSEPSRPERPERPDRPDRPQYDPPSVDHNPNTGPGVGGDGGYSEPSRPNRPNRPQRPDRPNRPDVCDRYDSYNGYNSHDPYNNYGNSNSNYNGCYDHNDDPETPAPVPSMSWHQVCRIASIRK